MNPTAALHMANGKKIIIELLPESAPNTVNSFIYVASRGLMDHHAIQRIVPGNWVDVTYTSFGKKEAQYLIPNEFTLNPGIEPLDSHPGMVGMGGYGEAGEAGLSVRYMYERFGIFLLEDQAAFEEYKRAGRQIKIIIVSLLKRTPESLKSTGVLFLCLFVLFYA